jgi:hypothetical protein
MVYWNLYFYIIFFVFYYYLRPAYAHNENQVKLSILSLNGATIFNEMIDTDNGLGYVNAEGALAPGIYIVNIVGAHASHSTRLIIR